MNISMPRARQRDPLKQLPYYHGKLSRHLAEVLLMSNGEEGSFLLRLVNIDADEYCISVRAKDQVKHFKLIKDGMSYMLGFADFESISLLQSYIANQPVLGSRQSDLGDNFENGTMVTLKYPYPNHVEEPQGFDEIRMHSTISVDSTAKSLKQRIRAVPMATKSGYLTKEGGSFKSWKRRWFVCIRNKLSYFENKDDGRLISTIDLTEATQCGRTELPGKEDKFTFALVCKVRTWNFIADNGNDMLEWLELLSWKIRQNTL
ncbi:dual adapter for phosphotyrosine and 3-phosphotyrosine and 3-phosphoinositide-like [Styela clava]